MPIALMLLALVDDSPIAPGATLKKVSDIYSFTEGPARAANGDVFFTDQPNDRIVRWTASGMVSDWKVPAGRSNGTAFDRQGNLIACADEKNQLWSIAPNGTVTVLLDQVDGKLMNGPNDVWLRRDGGIYFTDPLYPRPYWTRSKDSQMPGEYIYFLPKGQKQPIAVATDLTKPNGIVGTPDGKFLYVADIGAGKTYRYAIQPDGKLADKTLFCEMGSDGMSLDERGNLYLTGRGVTAFSKEGKKIAQIDVPEGWTANVTFGGRARKTLFITASKSIYTLEMNVKGAD